MEQSYLAQESERMNKAARKRQIRLIIAFICLIALMCFLGKDSIDFSDISIGSVPFLFVVLIGIMLVCSVINLIAFGRAYAGGSNLFLPYKDKTREEVGRIIDGEALEGKIQVEEYIESFADPKKASGEKVVLLPSYLLLFGIKGGLGGISKIIAVPRDKICWICAQNGKKGGPFIARLTIFTENKIYGLTGTDICYIQSIADKLYQYIPNIFSSYDPFVVSYELEDKFEKNPAEFWDIYENEKKQYFEQR